MKKLILFVFILSFNANASQNPNAPNTKQYSQSVLNRMGSSGSGESRGAGGSGDDSFESFVKSKIPQNDNSDDSFEAFAKSKIQSKSTTNKPVDVPVQDDDSFETFSKTYKHKPLNVTDNTTPETVTPTTADSVINSVFSVRFLQNDLPLIVLCGVCYLFLFNTLLKMYIWFRQKYIPFLPEIKVRVAWWFILGVPTYFLIVNII